MEKRAAIYIAPEKAAAYSAFMRELRKRHVRPADSEGPEALAEHYRQLDAARCEFFGMDHWPRGCLVQTLSKKAAKEQMSDATRAEIIAELRRDYPDAFAR